MGGPHPGEGRMSGRLAFLGPRGTFTEEAALRDAPDAQLLPCPGIDAVAAAVEAGEADEGVVPIENSIEGSVNLTLDLLIHDSSLRIAREVVLPIEHCLLAAPGTALEAVEVVYSHPQALAQCRRYLERHLPRARPEAALSTAAAVEELRRSPVPAAAIGTRRAAGLYGAQVLAHGIQDQPNNVTRFVVLAREDHPPTGRDRTSLCFAFHDDRPGLLYHALGEFAGRGINLSKIESRPSKQRLGRYVFLIDLEGHRQDPLVAEALEGLRRQVATLKVFGSYPRWQGPG